MTDEFVTEAAQAMGIDIRPEWAAEVRRNLELMFRMAATVLAFDLPDEAEPAPVFTA